MFRKVLVANRGEIAIRVIRACKELGIKTVAIRTEADKNGLWGYLADEVVDVPSYLDIEAIVSRAKEVGADAIHPGYGFLSEKAEFARACEREGIKFIGPPPSAMELSGDKVKARQAAERAGVPTVPGSGVLESVEQALEFARKVGFPVLLKAAGGGGGKGMRPVWNEEELKSAFRTASEEAKSAFGDPRLYLEKYIQHPRHIEVQVIADEKGNYAYLFERDCSLQRRNQKIVEESPAPHLPDKVRREICECAVALMKEIGYFNAGTVEFIMDAEYNFYFIEINARIQVEHPVTEMVTGIDIVKEGIKIASGSKLSFRQDEVKQEGHAIEVRIYAEDPDNNFVPSPGKIRRWVAPGGNGVRCDSWVYSGCEVPPYYDPLIAKLIVWGRTRDEAIERMKTALDETVVTGIKTNIPFLRFVMDLDEFRQGKITTWSIKDVLAKWEDWKRSVENAKDYELALITLLAHLTRSELSPSVEQFSQDGLASGSVKNHWKFFHWKEQRFWGRR